LLDIDGNIKISDFGLATLYIGDATAEGSTNRTELLHTTCGTPNYVAPEVLSNQGYDGRYADIWSIGVILYVLLAGFLPFEEKTIAALFSKIKAADYSYPSWFSSEAKSLLDGILVANPSKRFTLDQVTNHPWTKGPMTNPKFPMSKIPIDVRMETSKKPVGMAVEEEGEDKDDSETTNNAAAAAAYNNSNLLMPPPPPKSPSMTQGRGSFFTGGVSNEQALKDTPLTNNSSNSASASGTAGNSSTAQANRTQKAGASKSVFSCFCAPFTAFQDLENYSGDAASPQASPSRPLPVS
jgi:serine/threonine protein kinase